MKDFGSECFCFLLSCMSKIVDSCSVMTLYEIQQVLFTVKQSGLSKLVQQFYLLVTMDIYSVLI